jgi:hypothetical protein
MANLCETIGINDLKRLLTVLSPNVSVCIRGRHAIGKSQLVYQVSEALGLPVVERRLSQMTEGDIIGLPVLTDSSGETYQDLNGATIKGTKGQSTSFRPCDWLIQASEQPVVLFLDERNRALPAVKQALFQLTDSKRFYGIELHPDTRIIVAENVGDEYMVESCDPAEDSRMLTVMLEPSVQEWLDYAKDRCHPAVVEFVRGHGGENVLEHRGAFEPNKKYPDRRSWVKFNDELVHSGLVDASEEADLRMVGFMAGGFLGPEVGRKFAKFLRERDKDVTALDVLKDWEACKKKLTSVRQDENGNKEEYIKSEVMTEVYSKVADFISALNHPETGSSDLVIGDFEAANLGEFAKDAGGEIILNLHNTLQKISTSCPHGNASKNRLVIVNGYVNGFLVSHVTPSTDKLPENLSLESPLSRYSKRLKAGDATLRPGLFSGEKVTWKNLSKVANDGAKESDSKRGRGRPRKS